MTFRIKWDQDEFTCDSDKTGKVYYNDTKICDIRAWGFHSCACHALENWNTWGMCHENFTGEEFWQFITSKHLHWEPDEAMLLISDKQLTPLRKIWKHPKVRLRDKFTNKAHGPNDVYLFRYSKIGDWQKRSVDA